MYVQVSLIWDSRQDLDLHCITPAGGHIWYSRKEDKKTGARLDVDNMKGGTSSVENIYFSSPTDGAYRCYVLTYLPAAYTICSEELSS